MIAQRRFDSGALVVLVCLAALTACSDTPEDKTVAATPDPKPPAALHSGIDVSWHSGTIDWPAVHEAGHTFVILKATEGVDLVDQSFAEHWRTAKEAGLVRGAYHFYVTEDDPEAQAHLFIDTVDLEPGDFVPVVDIELIGHGTPPGLPDRLRRWLEIVEDHYGVRPIIYTSPRFWNQHLDDSFGTHPLWIAEYAVDSPTLPAGWDRWHLWQFQGDADIPGVEKGADVSRVHHEVALDELRVPATTG